MLVLEYILVYLTRINLSSLRYKGFNLTELMVSLVVLATLVAITYPRFARTIEAATGKEARIGLELILGAEKFIFMQTVPQAYTSCNDTADCNTQLSLDLRPGNWDYAVVVNNAALPPTFSATATRTGAGAYAGLTITIDQGGSWAGTWPLP